MLKKIIVLITTLSFILSFVGCTTDSNTDTITTKQTDVTDSITTSATVIDDSLTEILPEYMTKLFGVGTINLEIIADKTEWANMLANAIKEEYISCDVVVNGVTFRNVGIRPKGNASLQGIVNSESNRYSFRLKFDKYVEGQTCFGMSDFVVNNMQADPSYLKEYLSYDIMTYIGVNSPLYEFANLTVNGEVWGFYLAVEKYDDAFLERTYGNTKGELYNVKITDNSVDDNQPFVAYGSFVMGNDGNILEGGGLGMDGGFVLDGGDVQASGAEEGGGDLKYSDDNIESYASIFENGVGKVKDEEKVLVIEALKALSENRDLEKYFDVDQVIRYFAAHTVVVNLDSYVSMMAMNYYLSENDGKISILPWDYNLAFDAMQQTNASAASAIVNFPIDTPVNIVSLEDRPLLNMIFKNEEYTARYHQYLQEIITGYFSNGKFASKVAELDSQINEYVKNDPSSFYTHEDYTNAVATIATLGDLRAQSIQGQLDGTVPSTADAQKANPDALISSDTVDMSVLGNTGMGGAALLGGNGGTK